MSEMSEFIMQMFNNKEETFEERVSDKIKEFKEKIRDSAVVNDAYGNSLEAIGTENKVDMFDKYGMSNDTLNFPLWLTLYQDSWVFKRAIDKPAQDEIRAGIELAGDADFSNVYRRLKKYRYDLIQLLQWGALFGGSVAVMMFDNVGEKDYAVKMDYGKLKKSKSMRLYVTDRWYGVSPSTETVTDMCSIDYGKPAYYNITLPDGRSVKFHHDYILRYEHRSAPKFVKQGLLQGWGYAEGSHIIRELERDDKLKSSIQSLIDKALIEVIKMSGMRGVFMGADTSNEAQLRKRLEMVNWGRNFNSLTFLDKDDEYDQHTFSGLGGLSDILQQNMWMIASALEMQGILFGDLKGGFSADEEALDRYDETINNRCENFVRPIYEKLLFVLYKLEGIDEKIDFEFKSLLTKKQDKEAIESLKNFTDLGSELLQEGVISLKQFGKALQTYTQKHIVDFGLTDEEIEKLDDKMQEEMENIDLMNVET